MKALEKLRDRNFKPGYHGEPTLELIAAEIEAEIKRDYMKLPVDADGVPIHCGERMRLDNGHEGDVWLIGVFDIMMSDHTCFDWAKSRHVKPRTIEDVLKAFFHDALDADTFCTVRFDDVLAKYADEIRELIDGDA